MKTLNKTLFPVVEVPVQMEGIINADDYKFIVRTDTSEVISCVTNKYKLVTNEEVLDKCTPILEQHDARLQECITFANGARTQWTWTLPNTEVTVSESDLINPQIIIKNSYDSSAQVSILGGIFRLVCSNGTIIGKVYGDHKSRHTIWNPSLINGWINNKVNETVDNINKVIVDNSALMRDTKLNNLDIPKVIKMFPEKGITELVAYLSNNVPQTYWDLLNAATFVATHRLNRNSESTHILEGNIYSGVLDMATAAQA